MWSGRRRDYEEERETLREYLWHGGIYFYKVALFIECPVLIVHGLELKHEYVTRVD